MRMVRKCCQKTGIIGNTRTASLLASIQIHRRRTIYEEKIACSTAYHSYGRRNPYRVCEKQADSNR